MSGAGQELLEVAPLLLPADSNGLFYSGFINCVGNQGFYLRISLKRANQIAGACVETDRKAKYLLIGYEDIVVKRQEQCPDLISFVVELTSILDQVIQSSPNISDATHSSFYCKTIGDVESIGWNRIVHLDRDFKSIKILCKDTGRREHPLTLNLSDKHPYVAPKCVSPIPFQPMNWSASSTINEILKEYEQKLKLYQPFWDMLTELDSAAWVIEPKDPTYSSTYRRIMLDQEKNLSMYIMFDHTKPYNVPECHVLGPDIFTAPVIQKLSHAELVWSTRKSVLDNLQTLLEIELPCLPAKDENVDRNTTECGICYSEQGSENSLPDVNCQNKNCEMQFHHSCLYEWFSGLPSNTHKTFNMIKGECPYCNIVISLKAVPS